MLITRTFVTLVAHVAFAACVARVTRPGASHVRTCRLFDCVVAHIVAAFRFMLSDESVLALPELFPRGHMSRPLNVEKTSIPATLISST